MKTKKFAWNLKEKLEARNIKIPITHLLEDISKALGHKNWQTACAIAPELSLDEEKIELSKNKWEAFEKTTPKLASFLKDTSEELKSEEITEKQRKEYFTKKIFEDAYKHSLEFADHWNMEELRHSLYYQTSMELISKNKNCDYDHPTKDEVFGLFFSGVLVRKEYGIDDFRTYESGFIKGLRDFYNSKIK